MNIEETKEEARIRKVSEEENPYMIGCQNRHLWSEGFRRGFSKAIKQQRIDIVKSVCEICGCTIDQEDKFTDEKHCPKCGWF